MPPPKPIYTEDPRDPRLKMYNDSLTAYNYGVETRNKLIPKVSNKPELYKEFKEAAKNYPKFLSNNPNFKPIGGLEIGFPSNDENITVEPLTKAARIELASDGPKMFSTQHLLTPWFEKPKQEVIYRVPVPTPKPVPESQVQKPMSEESLNYQDPNTTYYENGVAYQYQPPYKSQIKNIDRTKSPVTNHPGYYRRK